MHISMVYCANKLHNSHTTGNQSIPLLCLGSATTVKLEKTISHPRCTPSVTMASCAGISFV